MKEKIPQWMVVDEQYKPLDENERFLDKIVIDIFKSISKIKPNDIWSGAFTQSTLLKIILSLLTTVLVLCAKSKSFPLVIASGILLRICFFKWKDILKILRFEMYILLMMFLILSLYTIIKNLEFPILILGKIGIVSTLMYIVIIDIQWNCLIKSLKYFKLPNIYIFLIDIILKYIRVFRELSLNLFTALRVRAIGINTKKHKSMISAIKITFIKSHEISKEMIHAMKCRGFTRKYHMTKDKISRFVLMSYFWVAVIIIFLYICLR